MTTERYQARPQTLPQVRRLAAVTRLIAPLTGADAAMAGRIEMRAVGGIEAQKVPSTEVGQCRCKAKQTGKIVFGSHYGKACDHSKDFIVMANSKEGWRYGGGSFLNRQYSETMAILDRKAEHAARYHRNTSK